MAVIWAGSWPVFAGKELSKQKAPQNGAFEVRRRGFEAPTFGFVVLLSP